MLEKGVTVKRVRGIQPSFLSREWHLFWQSLPQSSIGELVSTKHSIRRVEWKSWLFNTEFFSTLSAFLKIGFLKLFNNDDNKYYKKSNVNFLDV